MSVVSVLLAIAQALPTVVRSLAPRPRRPVPQVWRDPHHWSDYDLQAQRVARHCVYCKQLQSMASEYCPGVPAR